MAESIHALMLGASAVAQEKGEKTVILVHGAFADGSSWDTVPSRPECAGPSLYRPPLHLHLPDLQGRVLERARSGRVNSDLAQRGDFMASGKTLYAKCIKSYARSSPAP
jgi:hypothetical protein